MPDPSPAASSATAPSAAAPPVDDLASQALENLVNQFVRPLDFLRELAQNAIDAGSPRVEVWLAWQGDGQDPDQGTVEIHVDDTGEGMDEEIIDKQLTRLFSSSKEDDLTKIGKFGIGFTSIFAIRPDAVLLRTGRQGESWELLFHPDRSYDKVRIAEPVAGTRITLFKRIPRAELETLVADCRWSLKFWCEHSDTPIQFWDRTRGDAAPPVPVDDPFAAFVDPAGQPRGGLGGGPEILNGPMRLDQLDLSVEGRVHGVQVVVGLGPRPRYAFYNGGLTLLNTENDDALGEYVHRLGHLSFKVKSDRLEHTLTRDNVLQDEHWQAAMAALTEVSAGLQGALLAATVRAVERGEALGTWHRHMAQECRARAMHRVLEGARQARILRDHRGRGISLEQVEAAYEQHGATLLHPGAGPLSDALEAQGTLLLHDDPDLRALLDAVWRPPVLALANSPRRWLRADEIFVLPTRVPASALRAAEQRLLARAASLIEASVGGRLDIEPATFPAGAREALVVEGPADGGVFRRTGRPWRWLPGILRRRLLLLNRDHPYYLSQVVLGGERPTVAAFALAQAILEVEGFEGERSFRALAQEAGALLGELKP